MLLNDNYLYKIHLLLNSSYSDVLKYLKKINAFMEQMKIVNERKAYMNRNNLSQVQCFTGPFLLNPAPDRNKENRLVGIYSHIHNGTWGGRLFL